MICEVKVKEMKRKFVKFDKYVLAIDEICLVSPVSIDEENNKAFCYVVMKNCNSFDGYFSCSLDKKQKLISCRKELCKTLLSN